jgi:hypothetical protein
MGGSADIVCYPGDLSPGVPFWYGAKLAEVALYEFSTFIVLLNGRHCLLCEDSILAGIFHNLFKWHKWKYKLQNCRKGRRVSRQET